jgi:hypothetical protein
MSDRTGRAMGTLSPIIFFERADGKVDLPVFEAGHPELARQVYESPRYKYHPTEKWEWRETGHNMREVDAFQKRLTEQELRQNEVMFEGHQQLREMCRKRVAESLRQTMCSSSTSPYEREFIQHYLNLRDQPKRDRYGQELMNRNYFLMAREYDSKTQIIDVAPDQPGDFWRNEIQQKD